jgi:predicted MPP superfamily phosphohydrolase
MDGQLPALVRQAGLRHPTEERFSSLGRELPRRDFLKAVAVLSAGAALGFDGVCEVNELKVESREIYLRRLPPALDGFRLVQLSDIHFSELMTKEHLQRIVAAVNAQTADLVALTGDYVTMTFHANRERRAHDAWPCAQVLRQVKARLGQVAVLGNHDLDANPEVVTEALAANQIQVLRNRSIPIESGGARFWLAGMDNVLEGKPDPDAMLHKIPTGERVVLAVHEPDCADQMRKYPIDLQLSGHSHGGQIRLPMIGPLYLPEGARKYPMGYYRLGSLQLYTNRGVGVIHVPVRFLCPPELTVLTLRSGEKA